MDNSKIQFVGEPVNHHGSYSFYKSFKYLTKNGTFKTISINEFFFVKIWNDSDLVSIGELQLLYEDKNSDNILSSLRLYFLPENTPDGRIEEHGEDEVMAITEKVVLKVEDLISWIIPGSVDWRWGHQAAWRATSEITEIKPEPGCSNADAAHSVVVLSFPRYCRYRSIARRLEGATDSWMQSALVAALGGVLGVNKQTRVLFCKETFDYPDLETHELLCNHLAPKLTGRPRKKLKKRNASPGSESNESEGSSYSTESAKVPRRQGRGRPPGSGTYSCLSQGKISLVASAHNSGPIKVKEQEFLQGLYVFMEKQKQPIDRIPSLGFKQIDLFKFYNKVRGFGGYEQVTTRKLWKRIYDDMGGSQSNTSAATCTRKHYERLLLQYELELIQKAITNQPPRKKSAATGDKKPLVKKSSTQDEVITVEEVPLRRPSTDDSPSLKKRKLEILQQGGLEVTPVGQALKHHIPTQQTMKRTEPTAAVTSQLNNQVSITVTPDVHHLTVTPDLSHMLGNDSYKQQQQQQHVHQHNMFSRTGRIYGNPKLDVSAEKLRPDLEVLDLTIKPTSTTTKYKTVVDNRNSSLMIQPQNGHHRNYQQLVQKQQKSNKISKANLSSSLEITLVNSSGEKLKTTPNGSTGSSTKSNGSSRIPSSTVNPLHNMPQQHKNNPYNLPLLSGIADPAMYYALYNSQLYSQAQGSHELYKSLLAHPASLPLLACYNQAFPGLPKDGSTSITPLPRPSTKQRLQTKEPACIRDVNKNKQKTRRYF